MNLKWLPALALAAQLHATTIDLGPNGSSYFRSYNFGQLNESAITGQTIAFDLNFNTSIHLFQGTNSSFIVGLGFQTTGTTNIGFILGSGYILNSLGQQMCAVRPLGSANSNNGVLFVGLFPLFSNETGLLATDITRPLDFYGAHFELTLPNDPGLTITQGGLSFFALDLGQPANGHGFRVGPQVPDGGTSFTLLVIALIVLLAFYDQKTIS